MTILSSQLLTQIRKVAQELPPATLKSVIEGLANLTSKADRSEIRKRLCQQLPNTYWRQEVMNLFSLWQVENRSLDNTALAAALSAAAHCEIKARQESSLELVWTGPNPEEIPLRRTDQALLQLIHSAKQNLMIVSFAVYKVPEVSMALLEAINRGVMLRIIAESPENSEGKIAYGLEATFGKELLQRAEVIVWPKDKRPRDRDGRHGSLHAKCAVADGRRTFISSANLTNYALSLNIEMGLMLEDQQIAREVTEQINSMIRSGHLVPVQADGPY